MKSYEATILGGIWWPYGALCSITRQYEAENDAEAIEKAQTTEAGDFSSVDDVCVYEMGPIGIRSYGPARLVKDWETEEYAMQYADTISDWEE